jgi:hypothetical protein
MRDHTRVGAAHTAALEDAFLDRSAVARVPVRLERIPALGLDVSHVVPRSFDTPHEVSGESLRLLGTEALPAFAR